MLSLKLTYKKQMIILVFVILLANILSTIFKHWIYRSLGYVICGLLFVIHPVLPNGAEVSERTLRWMRMAGFILVLIGVFTRSYIY